MTDPLNPDTDEDGLTDGEEVNRMPPLNPLAADSDMGGTPDGQEIMDMTDPLDPADDIVPLCPAGWLTGDLNMNLQEGGNWVVNGDTTGAATRGGGSCGGGSGENIYTFVAPEAGSYRFVLTSADPGADTVMYIRGACDDPMAELVCNDDDVGLLSGASVDMMAGQRVFVFVDGYYDIFFEEGWQGAYTLTVTPPAVMPPPPPEPEEP